MNVLLLGVSTDTPGAAAATSLKSSSSAFSHLYSDFLSHDFHKLHLPQAHASSCTFLTLPGTLSHAHASSNCTFPLLHTLPRCQLPSRLRFSPFRGCQLLPVLVCLLSNSSLHLYPSVGPLCLHTIDMVGRPPQPLKNAPESIISDATAAREESRAAVAAVDPYAYGTPGSQKVRALARELWENFTEIILQKKSVF
jgi:hypothetical protein